ncbi:MAG: glycosyltransferase family 2 protein [Clostridia bacterium]|nr:glycosyltransferase family 2 protein [Clostridia bacterium]
MKKYKFTYYMGRAIKLVVLKGPVNCLRLFKNKYITKRRLVAPFEISARRRRHETETAFDRDITFSILVPLYNTPLGFLKEMIASVRNQTYGKWQLCLADGSDSDHDYVGNYVKSLNDDRIVYKKLEKNLGISENTNACIDLATGDYIALFDHDDLLHPSALFRIMQTVCETDADFVYTDECTFLGKNPSHIVTAHYKADFAIDTLRSYNYICHLSVFSRHLMDHVGRFRPECDGSQDYDMILRLTERAEKIVHIPELLYYWRGHKNSTAQDIGSKPYIVNAAHKALADHLDRNNLNATVTDSMIPSTYRIRYDIEGEPLVSILIPNMDHIETLDVCIRSIFEKTTYDNFEVIIIENNSTKRHTFDYYSQLQEEYPNVKVVTWKDKFNYSAINNFGFEHAKGDYVLLLNNDVEIITPDWIQEMLMFAQRSDVGAVGAMLYYPDDTIQHAGVILGIGGVAGHSHKMYPRNSYGYMSRATIAQNLSAVTFACVMMRSDVYREVEGLDPAFEVAFNDVDMCMRIHKAGYLIVFTPYAELYHYESKSRGLEDTPQKVKRFNSEVDRFKERWGKELEAGDPYYNPNLSLFREDFSFKNDK